MNMSFNFYSLVFPSRCKQHRNNKKKPSFSVELLEQDVFNQIQVKKIKFFKPI